MRSFRYDTFTCSVTSLNSIIYQIFTAVHELYCKSFKNYLVFLKKQQAQNLQCHSSLTPTAFYNQDGEASFTFKVHAIKAWAICIKNNLLFFFKCLCISLCFTLNKFCTIFLLQVMPCNMDTFRCSCEICSAYEQIVNVWIKLLYHLTSCQLSYLLGHKLVF